MMADKYLAPSLPVPASNSSHLPLFVDICLNASQIIVLVVAIITGIVSILARVDALTVILRTAIAILAVGIPLYILNFLIGRYFVKATLEKMEETMLDNQKKAQRKKEEEQSASELDREA